MAWLAVDKDGEENINLVKPTRGVYYWMPNGDIVELPKGSIKRLIGSELTWDDEPVEFNEVAQ